MKAPLLTIALIATTLPAQLNLVTNGDFSNGQANWTFGGYTVAAKVDNFDTDGLGSNPCFNNRPGGQTTPPPYPPNWMEQNVLIVQGVEHLFTADIANARPGSTAPNADGGTVEVFVDGDRVARHAFGFYTLGTTKRERLCVRFTPTTTGSRALRITFHRSYLTSTGSNPTPTVYIDNINLNLSPNLPVLCPRGERKVPGTLNLEVSGTPQAKFGVFVSPLKLAGGVQIPGFNGQWWLGVPNLTVVIGLGLDNAGLARLPLPVPNISGLAGTPFFWQAIQQAGSQVSIGEPARFGVYK